MADALTAVVGLVLMIAFLWILAGTLNELPLSIACVIGVALMLRAFWNDAFAPLFRRGPNGPTA